MKNVLITGATSGIGEQLAKDYAADGWQVFACGRNQDKLQSLQASSDRIQGFAFDITDREHVLQAAADLNQPIHLLILNAGNCEYIDDPLQFDDQLFERIIKVNLIALGYCLHAFLPKIAAGGQLAIVSSSAAYLPFPRATAYGTSKAGASYLTKTLAIELERHSIDVTLVSPGFVETPLTNQNEFEMPMQVSTQYASKAIRKGLKKRKREIHFPSLFTLFLKVLASLPDPIWRSIAKKMLPKQAIQS
ncbi:MAG: SDR family NAD(P)-dependent oxidoreductase [Aestuariibacter sp.]